MKKKHYKFNNKRNYNRFSISNFNTYIQANTESNGINLVMVYLGKYVTHNGCERK